MNTNDLISEIAKKDESSFMLLFTKLGNRIKGVAFNVLKDEAKAEDILQEVMFTVWQKAPTFIPFFNGERWILKIAKNKAISVLRKVKYEKIVDWKDDKTVNTLNYFKNEFISHFEDEVEINLLLEMLTANERLVFVMKYNKYSTDEIAKVSGLTKRQVTYEYQKAINKLKKIV